MVGLFLSVAPLPSAALALLLVCGVVTTVGGRVDSMPYGRPIIRSLSQNYHEAEDRDVLLSCEVEALGENLVIWKQGDRTISAGSIMVRKDERMGLAKAPPGDGDPTHLRIRRLRLEDGGLFIRAYYNRMLPYLIC